MATKIAEMVGNNIKFPPEPKKKKPEFGGEIVFKMSVLSRHREMLKEVVVLSEAHNTFEAEDNRQLIVEREAEVDCLIEGSQQAAIVFKELEDEYFAEIRKYNKAKDYLNSANEEYRQVRASVDNQEALLTRSQKSEQEKLVEKYQDRAYKAASVESLATMALNNTIRRKNDAATAAVQWEVAARQAQSELDALLQGRNENRKPTGFQAV